MKREEIEFQIEEILHNQIEENTRHGGVLFGNSIKELTDLFIALSYERCKEQRANCAESYLDNINESVRLPYILQAPLPEIK